MRSWQTPIIITKLNITKRKVRKCYRNLSDVDLHGSPPPRRTPGLPQKGRRISEPGLFRTRGGLSRKEKPSSADIPSTRKRYAYFIRPVCLFLYIFHQCKIEFLIAKAATAVKGSVPNVPLIHFYGYDVFYSYFTDPTAPSSPDANFRPPKIPKIRLFFGR